MYKCTVSLTTITKQQSYLGLAEGEWKQQYYNYTQSFRKAKHKNDMAPFKYLLAMLKIVPGSSNSLKRCV